MVSESHVTWATYVPILIFLCFTVVDLGLIYVRDIQTDVSSIVA